MLSSLMLTVWQEAKRKDRVDRAPKKKKKQGADEGAAVKTIRVYRTQVFMYARKARVSAIVGAGQDAIDVNGGQVEDALEFQPHAHALPLVWQCKVLAVPAHCYWKIRVATARVVLRVVLANHHVVGCIDQGPGRVIVAGLSRHWNAAGIVPAAAYPTLILGGARGCIANPAAAGMGDARVAVDDGRQGKIRAAESYGCLSSTMVFESHTTTAR